VIRNIYRICLRTATTWFGAKLWKKMTLQRCPLPYSNCHIAHHFKILKVMRSNQDKLISIIITICLPDYNLYRTWVPLLLCVPQLRIPQRVETWLLYDQMELQKPLGELLEWENEKEDWQVDNQSQHGAPALGHTTESICNANRQEKP
jgi:hypothetical protein